MSNIFKTKIFYVCTAILSIILVAWLGAIFTMGGTEWLASINQPNEWPPDFIFSIIWTILYVLAFVVLLLMISRNELKLSTIILFCLNGIFNVLWCLVFFQFNSLLWGLIVIIFNIIVATILIISLYRLHKSYAYILIAYPIWLYIATALNIAVWILN